RTIEVVVCACASTLSSTSSRCEMSFRWTRSMKQTLPGSQACGCRVTMRCERALSRHKEHRVIVRKWRGKTRSEDRAAYLAYLQTTGLRKYAAWQASGVQVAQGSYA